jgi:prophage regulatory protein
LPYLRHRNFGKVPNQTVANPVGFAGTLKEKAMQPEPTPARDRLIKLPEAESLSGLKKSTIYSKIKEGTFPRPVRLSSRAVAFSESAVLRWVQARIQAGGNT